MENESFTPIPNDVYEWIIANRSLNGTQKDILHAICRATYGYQKKAHYISLGFLSEKTGIKKSNISINLNKLIEKDIIKVYENETFNSPRKIGFNEKILSKKIV